MYCAMCGAKNDYGAKYCVKCGALLKNVEDEGQNSLGPYQLLDELGRGAMARVWRAWDPHLSREVAIKEPLYDSHLSPAVLDEMGRRFVREGVTAASLNHPNIVTIHAADIYDGRPAIVMELIVGSTLSELLQRGVLGPEASLEVLDQLLDAVSYAHAHGVIHRDIKPDNVFVTAEGRVKLADFGIARSGSDAMTVATVAGSVLGTPGYMLPEQATGATVDARSDLFSIGVVAYEMFAGRHPFGVSDGADATTLLYRIVHEPAQALPDGIDQEIPESVRPTIMRALSKNPDDRPQSAEVFKSMLHSGVVTDDARVQTWKTARPAKQTKSLTPAWLPYTLVGLAGALVLAVVLQNAFSGQRGSGLLPMTAQESAAGQNITPVEGVKDDEAEALGDDTIQEEEAKSEEVADDELSKTSKHEQTTAEAMKISETEPEPEPKTELNQPQGTYPPSFTRVDASSEQSADGYASDSYSPYNVLDKDGATAWIEGVNGPGVGEWIQLSADSLQQVSGIEILNGFPKSVEIYYANYRPQDVSIELSDGYRQRIHLDDTCGTSQSFLFDGVHNVQWMRLTIDSYYDTNRWTDNAIAEIGVF